LAIVTSYSTLQTAVTDYLARSDLSGFTPNFIQNFEEKFYRESKNWASWMVSQFNVTVASNVAAVPAAYLGLVNDSAYMSGQSGQVKRIGLAQLYARYPRNGGTGQPRYFARNGANFEFGPIAADGQILVGPYYAKPTALRSYSTGGADAIAHFLIVNAPDLLMYGALLEATPFLKDDSRIMIWKGFYDDALEAYRSRFREEDHAAPMMVPG
jgi:hypothetical protein